METFLLIAILIVMLGALGWLPGVIRVLLILSIICGGVIALIMWWGSKLPEQRNPQDSYFKELDQKIYSETKDRRLTHDHSRR